MTTIEILQMLQEYFGKELSETQARIYLKTLDDIDSDVLEDAALDWIKTGRQFFPKVVELRTAAGKIDAIRADQISDRRSRPYEPNPEDRAWWDSLPRPAETDEELAERWPGWVTK